MNIKTLLKKPYHRVFIKDKKGYVAYVEEFPGCVTQGYSIEETNRNLEDAMECWIKVCLEDKLEIPAPANKTRLNS